MNFTHKKELYIILLLFLFKWSNVVFAETVPSSSLSDNGLSSVCFDAANNFFAGTNPNSVITNDFNGDGKIDLAVANLGSNDVSILLGNGDGTFTKATSFNTGSPHLFSTTSTRSIASGDFNEDGKIDIAVTHPVTNDVSIFLGNGDGTFVTAKNFIADKAPISIVTNDFNGDNKMDLAIANFGSNNVSILLGEGDGTFATAKNFAVDTQPVFVTASDFNGDGKTDLAVVHTNYNDKVSILLGNGDGTFGKVKKFAIGSYSFSVTTNDFNSDGKIDLATANSGNYISVLLGNGNGTFNNADEFYADSIPVSIISNDFNNDGKIDLAVANSTISNNFSSNNVSILLGNGNGTFRYPKNFSVGDRPYSVIAGDFNDDGKIDLAVANLGYNLGNSNVSILLNSSSCVSSITVNPDLSGVWRGELAEVPPSNKKKLSKPALLKLCVVDGELKGLVHLPGVVNNGEIISQVVKSENEVNVTVDDHDGEINSIDLKLDNGQLSIEIYDYTESFVARKIKVIKRCR